MMKGKQSVKRYDAVCRAWDKLNHTIETVQLDDPEQAAAAFVTIAPCIVVGDAWGKVLDQLDDGEPVTIKAGEEGAPWPLGPFPERVVVRTDYTDGPDIAG